MSSAPLLFSSSSTTARSRAHLGAPLLLAVALLLPASGCSDDEQHQETGGANPEGDAGEQEATGQEVGQEGDVTGNEGDDGEEGQDAGSDTEDPADDSDDDDDDDDDSDANDDDEFEPLSVRAAVAKVKSVLTGLPPTDTELQAVLDDESALAGLIDGWMTTPEFERTLLGLFEHEFQQKEVSILQYNLQSNNLFFGLNGPVLEGFVHGFTQGFVLSVMDIVQQRQPFTEVLTTDRFYMNAPMMMMAGYVDGIGLRDDRRRSQRGAWLLSEYPNLEMTFVDASEEPIALEDSLDPNSANYMRFAIDVGGTPSEACRADLNTPIAHAFVDIMHIAEGRAFRNCRRPSSPWFTDEDYQLRPVRIRRAGSGEQKSEYWDLLALRDTEELVFEGEHSGFLTTPGFFANWPTNVDNAFRVTAHQALVIALGHELMPSLRANSGAHARTSGTDCEGCHQVLDPLRDYYMQSFTTLYGPRMEQVFLNEAVPSTAVLDLHDGSPSSMGFGVRELASSLAEHPAFAPAWVFKMCMFANSGKCDRNDPELARIAEVFVDSGFDYLTMMRELFSSPVVTFREITDTWRTHGIPVAIARREEFCARMSLRLEVENLCSLRGTHELFPGNIRGQLKDLSTGIPATEYARGAVDSVYVSEPSLFSFSAAERFCDLVATRIVDGRAGETRFSASQLDEALDAFVHRVIGVPKSAPMAEQLRALLKDHYDTVQTGGETPTNALRSTFTVACSSPGSISAGL